MGATTSALSLTRAGLSGSSGAPVSPAVGRDDAVALAAVLGLAFPVAARAVLSEATAARSAVGAGGRDRPPAMNRASDKANATAPARRFAGSKAQERRPVARTYSPVSATAMARKSRAPPSPPPRAPTSMNSAVIPATTKVEARGLRGFTGDIPVDDDPKGVR